MGHEKDVDANYVFSLMKPCYSVERSTRKEVEESVMDSFQDFLISLEDEQKISGYTEALTWNYDDGEDRRSERQQSDKQPAEKVQTADVYVAGVLGWLTGQRHRPIDRNPKHTICFPRVAACGRELTLPVCNMGDTTISPYFPSRILERPILFKAVETFSISWFPAKSIVCVS